MLYLPPKQTQNEHPTYFLIKQHISWRVVMQTQINPNHITSIDIQNLSETMMNSMEERSEIVFFDVETTIPFRKGQGYSLLEFGAILVCPRRLVELHSYSTLIKPSDLSSVSASSVRCNGITRDAVATAPSFQEIADQVFDILHGRIWAGHNIVRFDCVRIREAFEEIGRPAPEPKGTIDSLTLLTQRFGRRAGNMKMATLATYFGLGEQTHRSLDDVRMNLEVIKYCSTVLFLESSLPSILATNTGASPTATPESQSNNRTSLGERSLNSAPPILTFQDDHPVSNIEAAGPNLVDFNMAKPDAFNMAPLIDEIKAEPKQQDARMEEVCVQNSTNVSADAVSNEGSSGYAGFLDPDEVEMPSVSASLVPSFWGNRVIQLVHKDVPLHLCCAKLTLRFGVSKKFTDSAGRPRMSIVVDSPSTLCQVLDVCDQLAQRLSEDSGTSSSWRPVVIRKSDFTNSSTIRLNIPTISNFSRGSSSVYATDIYQKDATGNCQRLVFNRFDATQLDSLFVPGVLVDAFFSLSVYDYQQFAGIRLVAKKLIINS